jgi:cytochrome c oxidase subunit 3
MSALPPAEQFEDFEQQHAAARFGMWIFLVSELMLFAGLFALYAAYRVLYPADFAAAAGHDDVIIGTSNTAVLLTSSLAVALALHAARLERPRAAMWLLLASIALGLLFLTLKGVEYAEHFRDGIFPGAAYHYAAMPAPGARIFFTLYFLTTGLHALHVTAGLVILGWLAVGCAHGRYTPASHTALELGGLYWHLIDIVWIFLWPMLYLLHR